MRASGRSFIFTSIERTCPARNAPKLPGTAYRHAFIHAPGYQLFGNCHSVIVKILSQLVSIQGSYSVWRVTTGYNCIVAKECQMNAPYFRCKVLALRLVFKSLFWVMSVTMSRTNYPIPRFTLTLVAIESLQLVWLRSGRQTVRTLLSLVPSLP